MCGIRLTVPPIYSKILTKFPQKLSFCFAYGSGVKLQLQNVKPSMFDFVYCVENADKWHQENLKLNSSHYSFLKFFGHNVISKFQENSGARVYFNTLVNIDDVIIKYGVISRKDLITDLLEWSDLYLAGRLHKPVEIVRKTTNAELQTALQLNLQSAVHAALLLLPESFTEYDFYHTICNLSYSGDFRMIVGENKNKVSNIVKPQLNGFRNLYKPLIKSLHDYVEFPANTLEENNINLKNCEISKENPVHSPNDLLNSEYGLCCKQDVSPLAKLHHLNQLPRWPQKAITRFWNHDTVAQDTEDVLRAIAYDPDCGSIVEQCINDIVWRSSIRQSLKGILTAGIMKSVKYSMNMPYPLSDEESSDSDNGVRFKTANTRDKFKPSSSSTLYNTKSYKNDYKHSLHVNSCKTKYDISNINNKESKSKGTLKYRHEKTSRRKEDKYNRITTPEKSHSSNDCKANKGYTNDNHSNIKRKRYNELNANNKDDDKHFESVSNKCTKEKRKFSSQIKMPNKTDNYSQRSDLLTFGPSLPAKNIIIDEKFIPEFKKRPKISEISNSSPKVLSSTNNTMVRSIYENESYFGPALPEKYTDISKNINPEIKNILTENQVSILSMCNTSSSSQSVTEDNYFGPSLPPKVNTMEETNVTRENLNLYGPSVPLHLINNIIKKTEPLIASNLCRNLEKYSNGPVLNQYDNFEKDKVNKIYINRSKVIGPTLPDHVSVNIISDSNIDATNEINTNESDSEDCIIGPLPAKKCINTQLEERALQIKLDLLNESVKEPTTREEWMLELPEIHSVAQVMGPRKFRTKEMPDLNDRSVWTDTAKDKLNKKSSTKGDIKLEANLNNIREKDLIQEEIVDKQKKSKRLKSLIDIHSEELHKKKMKDNSIPDERRPFSRDIDLKINRFDEAQTKAIIKKARLLDNRFASGQSKFL